LSPSVKANPAVPTRQYNIQQFIRNSKQQEDRNDLSKSPSLLLGIESIPLDRLFQRHDQINAKPTVRSPIQSKVEQGLTGQLLSLRIALVIGTI
jgi:hypothetical protein